MASTGSLRNVEGASGKKYGLIMPVKSKKVNISFGKNKKANLNSKPIKVNPLFSELNDEEDEDEDNLSTLASSRKNINLELRAMTKNASKQVEAEYQKAIEEDPNVYDYDEVYDSMKRDELERKGKHQNKDEKKKPKYIASLLASAERRKKEQMRIMERRIQKEREEEGDKYKDKEMFVTSAYKEQQDELRRLEEEERKKEEQEEANKGSMTGFYRNILNSRAHDPIKLKTNEDNDKKELNKTKESEEEESEEEDQLKEALNAGKKVALNDDNEIIDKRQLLNAGLNISKKKVKSLEKERQEERKRREEERRRAYELKKEEERKKREEERKRREAIKEQRKRAYEYVQSQKMEKIKAKEAEIQKQKEELQRKMSKRSTDDSISDAKRRYLERKKEKERLAALKK
ncbi:hypothetical protein H8356DRAFT_1635616 [Neocallimastix lanati (nom. inval.)]|jgi:hypothetical protein|nr:hypothetical protein H8356DRAFT_1635616 [Neocallimastix sp. JGI-2020a]